MRQFAGHWYSGRAARLCAVEALLVALSLWVTGRQAAGNLPAAGANPLANGFTFTNRAADRRHLP